MVASPPVTRLGPDASALTRVCLDVDVAAAEELTATLYAPSGQRLTLVANDGAGRRGLRGVCFSADAPNSVDALADGSNGVRPRADWRDLGGADAAGEWTLELSDARGFLESSVLYSWRMEFGTVDASALTTPPGVFATGGNAYAATPSAHSNYAFSYTDLAGCERTIVYPVVVRLPCALEVQRLGFRSPSCAQRADGELLVTATGNQGAVTYRLGAQVSTDGKFAGLPAGTLAVSAIDSAQCTDSLQLSLDAPPRVEVGFAERLQTCQPASYNVEVLLGSEVGATATAWLDDATASGLRQNLPPGRYTFRSEDERGCVDYHPLLLPEPRVAEVALDIEPLGCADDGSGSIRVDVRGVEDLNYDLTWDDGAAGSERAGLSAGTYAGEVLTGEGCVTRFEAVLGQPEPLAAMLEVEPSYCPGEASGAILVVPETADAYGLEYRLDGGPWQAEPLFYGLGRGTHTVELRNPARCHWEEQVFVGTASLLDSNVLQPVATQANYGEEVPLAVVPDKLGGLTRVLWRYTDDADIACDTCAATTLTPYGSGSVLLMVEDTLGCRVELSAQLLLDAPDQVFVPTGFTPDGIRPDDRFLRVHGRTGTVIEQFAVFDRWGTRVFVASDFAVNATRGWDGTYRGQPAPAGPYLYEVLARDRGGAPIKLRGSTTLLR